MDAIKIIFISLFFIPTILFGQKAIYPKDTIYIKFEKKRENKKWFGNYGYGRNKKVGTLFNLKDKNDKHISLFSPENSQLDTLCNLHLKDYKISTLKEIDEKRDKWIFENKRPPADRNGVFQTYLIEIISKEKFVIYPVIWRNEGTVD